MLCQREKHNKLSFNRFGVNCSGEAKKGLSCPLTGLVVLIVLELKKASHAPQNYTMMAWIKTLHNIYHCKPLLKTKIDSVLNIGPESPNPQTMP